LLDSGLRRNDGVKITAPWLAETGLCHHGENRKHVNRKTFLLDTGLRRYDGVKIAAPWLAETGLCHHGENRKHVNRKTFLLDSGLRRNDGVKITALTGSRSLVYVAPTQTGTWWFGCSERSGFRPAPVLRKRDGHTCRHTGAGRYPVAFFSIFVGSVLGVAATRFFHWVLLCI